MTRIRTFYSIATLFLEQTILSSYGFWWRISYSVISIGTYASTFFLPVSIIPILGLQITHLLSAADTVVIFFFVQVVLETSNAIAEFQLDPRARPPFDSVFYYQYCLTTTISVELFLRILHLVVTFSVLNSVKSKVYVLRKIDRLSCFSADNNFSHFPFGQMVIEINTWLATFYVPIYNEFWYRWMPIFKFIQVLHH